jgi:hypothetical protein
MSRKFISAAARKAGAAGEAADAGGAGAPGQRNKGLGRIIVAVYGILALAATVRGVFQVLSEFNEAPVAYSLSLFSGLVYIVATVTLAGKTARTWAVSLVAVLIELAGVLVIGTLSLVLPAWFAHDSVWSHFGSGYGWIPLVLPVVGLWWLHKHRP